MLLYYYLTLAYCVVLASVRQCDHVPVKHTTNSFGLSKVSVGSNFLVLLFPIYSYMVPVLA